MNLFSGTFTAIDFETAHYQPWSICQVGLVRVENGIIKHRINQLIQPPNNYIHPRYTSIHGITSLDTLTSPTFDRFWPEMKELIAYETVVAHNIGFDATCLAKTLQYYDLAVPKFKKACTLKIYKKGLAKICAELNIPLKHHDASSDAEACAVLYLKSLGI